MDNAVWVSVISALSALAGGGLALWGAMRAARIQAETAASQEARQWERQTADRWAATKAAKAEECLGWVLLAEARILDRLAQGSPSAPAAESPASAARQAYAVALLYLDALRPLAKAFYQATAQLQQAMDGGDTAAAGQWTKTWRESLSAIEDALSIGR